ncbi:MAG TPA: HesA/MoeB/ThiF family protein [Rectinemataceae bacterium]|nr:HesA/MoeB/ThiF family protein [Rectinemataceae bacterium]
MRGPGEREDLAAALVASADGGLLSWSEERDLSPSFGLSPREVEGAALDANLRLERYARNFSSIDAEGQARLHRSCVLVAGCGGLGGYLIEELARVGVGRLVVVDPDRIDASNLNRQLLATIGDLGAFKAELAERRVAAINPAVEVVPHVLRMDAANAEALLEGVSLAADALDSIPSRLELEDACARMGIVLVHGAIAGHFVQVSTVLPGSRSLHRLFGEGGPSRGIETELGNPSFTPAVAASIQAAEIVRILLGKPPALAGILFHLDLERMESVRLPLG